MSQIERNVAATDIQLSADQMKRLDEASVPAPSWSASLKAPAIRRMIFGDHDVTGWREQDRLNGSGMQGEWSMMTHRAAPDFPIGKDGR